MRKFLFANCLVLAVISGTGLAQAQLTTPSCTTCMQTQANTTNPITTTTTTTTTLANQITAALQGSVLNAGTLSQTTANTSISALGGPGSSLNTASLSNNAIMEAPTKASAGGAVIMNSSVNGEGILQASQNSGANAVQQNSVALYSTGTGGVLSGLSR
jgi:hypothetical protein